MDIVFLIGRVLFGGVFLIIGLSHFKNKHKMIERAKSKNVSSPEMLNFYSGLILIFSGTLLILGIFPDVALILIVIYLAIVNMVMHNFWKIKDQTEMLTEKAIFLKNTALIGASLMLIWLSNWPLSF